MIVYEGSMGKVVLCVLIMVGIASGYAIEGNWSVLSVGATSLADTNVTLQLSDFIFRKNSINQRLRFRGCKQFVIQALVEQNQIFFNANSYMEESITNSTCPASNPLDLIFRNLKAVFYFEINIDRLLLNDPFGRNIIVLKRIINAIPVDVTGVWTLGQFGNTRTALSAEITPTQLVFCQGNSVYNYSLDLKTRLIELVPIISNCPSVELINSLESSKYFRYRNGILNLFDQNVTLSVELVYSQAYDPSKPIFTIPSIQNIKNTTSNEISPANIVGRWQIRSLFKIPFKNSKYQLQFTKTLLRLSGGCANYEYGYELDASKQIITVGESRQNNTGNVKCAQSDDQLYLNGILRMYKYILNTNNGSQILNFYDQKGQIGYSLALEPKVNVRPVQNVTRNNQNVQITPVVDVALSPGRYLMLLLQRRDLPRVPLVISSKTITYKRCNDIMQTFQIEKPGAITSKITVKGGIITNNKCTGDTDEIYYGTLNLVRSFSYESAAGVVILKNQGGIETVSISKI